MSSDTFKIIPETDVEFYYSQHCLLLYHLANEIIENFEAAGLPAKSIAEIGGRMLFHMCSWIDGNVETAEGRPVSPVLAFEKSRDSEKRVLCIPDHGSSMHEVAHSIINSLLLYPEYLERNNPKFSIADYKELQQKYRTHLYPPS